LVLLLNNDSNKENHLKNKHYSRRLKMKFFLNLFFEKKEKI